MIKGHRRKMNKMLSFFTENRLVWTITELDLWHWYLHVSFDFEAMNFRLGTISSKEMEKAIDTPFEGWKSHYELLSMLKSRARITAF